MAGARVTWLVLVLGCSSTSPPAEPEDTFRDTVPPDDASCAPGETRCDGDFARACRTDGAGWDTEYCDPLLGLSCDADEGRCRGACAPRSLGRSYIGCEYYPTVTGNAVNSTFEFAVAISNTTTSRATVTIEWGTLTGPLVIDVLPGAVHIQRLPWVPDLKGCMAYEGISCSWLRQPTSALHPKGAFHLRSTQPVTVYQFNPLDYHLADEDMFSYSNDASLLFPVNAWDVEYVVAAWPATEELAGEGRSPGLLAVTARDDDTRVTITTRAGTAAAGLAPAFEAGVPQTVTLQQGDVLELFNWEGDLTGTRVEADKPVQAFGGHFCTYVPLDVMYCDHLEESIFPVATLARQYAVAPPAVPSLPEGKVRVVRIVAVDDDTDLTYDPPQSAGAHLDRAGDFVELAGTTETFVVAADKKVLVVQYMEGQDAGGDTGDPAMALAVPTDQFRPSYLFHAPTNYDDNYVEVFAPAGTTVALDGDPIGDLADIGASGLAHRRVQLDDGPLGDGNHEIHGDEPIGISVYGYGQYTSYWYPGGLDLEPVIID